MKTIISAAIFAAFFATAATAQDNAVSQNETDSIATAALITPAIKTPTTTPEQLTAMASACDFAAQNNLAETLSRNFIATCEGIRPAPRWAARNNKFRSGNTVAIEMNTINAMINATTDSVELPETASVVE